MRRQWCAMFGMVAAASPCFGQVHAADVILTVDNTVQLMTNTSDGVAIESERVFAAEFGSEGFAGFTNDPGFDSPVGALPPGVVLGFDIMRALRVWDGVAFKEIPTERIRVRKSGIDRFTPAADEMVPGFVFGDVNGSGVFHHHVSYALVDSPTDLGGVWLLELELWAESSTLGRTDPFWIVFAQGSGVAHQETAMQWVRDNLLASACPADFNDDGVLDFFDVLEFLDAFSAQQPSADLNQDTVFDFFDVQSFLNLFVEGCK